MSRLRAPAAEQDGYSASEHACFEAFRGDARTALALATDAVRVAETLEISFALQRAYTALGYAHATAERWREAAAAFEHAASSGAIRGLLSSTRRGTWAH